MEDRSVKNMMGQKVCCMLRVKEIACDNVVSQSCMCERVVWHSCGGRAQGRKTRTPHVGMCKPFQSCGLRMNCARRFPYIVRGSCFSCRLCLASIDLGLPKASFEASSMRHKNDMLTRCAQTTPMREENTLILGSSAVPKCRM